MVCQIPVIVMTSLALTVHVIGLFYLTEVSFALKAIDILLVALNLWITLNVLIGNPGIAIELLRHQ